MSDSNKTYRIRTKVGEDKPYKIDVPLTQTYEMFEILSLKLTQKNDYRYFDSNYGVIVGRVLANKGFGIPNAKVSIFIEVDEEESLERKILYNFVTPQDTNLDGVKYNLLPDFVDNACHQDVGTFPNKRFVLDNNDVLEVFDKYYKYTTVTNESGDYMLFGIPVGMQNLHVDIDLSDIGQLSQRPRDMIYKGYNINQFESPNKFKQSTNLRSLAQLYTQDKGLYVYPFYGNSNNGEENIGITRCDIQIEYEFEPTCVFMGSIVTDKGSNAIGKNCTGTDNLGKMSDLASGEGTIEMIRKTIDGKVEELQIKGNRLIDGDGVWCYQIPMNLDYVMTDEFGNIVPTDDPSKGIPTRTRARFRVSLDENPNDAAANKRCKFLVPNNPRYDEVDYPKFCRTKEADYEFGSATLEESYCDMFWNNVYTVKSYIPRLQKNKNSTNRKHTGIKLINHYGDNNPMPYNSLSIKLSFTYRLICVLVKVLIWIIATINTILGLIMEPICWIAEIFLTIANGLCFSILGIKPLCWLGTPFRTLGNAFYKMVVKGITLGSSFCDDGINKKAFYPTLAKIAPCVLKKVQKDFNDEQKGKSNIEEVETLQFLTITSMDNNQLITCIENNLAQSNDATSFNFQNDWVNGVLYAPLWFRKITPKKTFLFGLIKKKAKDQWCNADGNFNLMVFQPCALNKVTSTIESPVDGNRYKKPSNIINNCGKNCNDKITTVDVNNGLILTKETMLGQTVYYYKALEYNQQLANTNDKDGVILLFATDIVLLGSLNDCDSNGIPQFFKNLESTTYKLPTDILFTDTIIQTDAEGKIIINGNNNIVYDQFTEATGCDWGNLNEYDECGKMGKDTDGGLFYGIGCSTIEMTAKSCLNLSRICEFGVSLDEAKDVADLNQIGTSDSGFKRLVPDGFISFDELYNINERSMFATLNGNRLRTRLNKRNGLKEYDLRYCYVNNFDGLMKDLMRKSKSGNCNYFNNYNLEKMSDDYYLFRMGTQPYFYDNDASLPRYENSFYFYFGLKMGKTAIDKFNSQFFASCESGNEITSPISVETKPNSWCSDNSENADGYVLVDLSNVSKPCDIILNSKDNSAFGFNVDGYVKDILLISNLNEVDNIEPDKKIIIPNGDYELIVTDSEGNIITYNFSLKKKRLQFVYEKADNDVPNNQRIDKYKDYSTLFNAIKDFNEIIDFGGYIKINNIIDDFDNLSDDDTRCYRLEYKLSENNISDINNTFIKNYGGSFTFKVNNKGIIESCYTDDIIRFIDNSIYILTPLGDYYYNVIVTEICNCNNTEMDTSLNYSEVDININDSLPYKLYINDIDVDVFNNVKKYWKIGWDDNMVNPQIDSLYNESPNVLPNAWTNLIPSDNKVFNEYYDITKVEGYDEISILKDNLDTFFNANFGFEESSSLIKKFYDACVKYEKGEPKIDDSNIFKLEEFKSIIESNVINKNGETFDISDDAKLTLMKIKNKVIERYDVTDINGNVYIIDVNEKKLIGDETVIEYTKEPIYKVLINNIEYVVDFNNKKLIDKNKVEYTIKDDNTVTLANDETYTIEDKILTDTEGNEYECYMDIEINNGEIVTSKKGELKYQSKESNVDTIKSLTKILIDNLNTFEKDYNNYKIAIDDKNPDSLLTHIKQNFLNTIKETLWLTSDTQAKSITIRVQTNKYPIKYYLKYNIEERSDKAGINELTETYWNKYEDENEDVYSVEDIKMPTITNSDNEIYGYNGTNETINNKNLKISFGYDRQHGYNEEKGSYIDAVKWAKKPYGIRIINGREDKLPLDDKSNITLKDEKYFFFHIIDKILRFKMLSWSYIKNIPYPECVFLITKDNVVTIDNIEYVVDFNNKKLIDKNKVEYIIKDDNTVTLDNGKIFEVDNNRITPLSYRGNFINMHGLVTGVINNGIIPFNTFSFGNINVESSEILTMDSENAIPTKRYLNLNNNSDYSVENGGKGYLPVYNKQDVLRIEDNSAYISETIYGNMSIDLISNEIEPNNLNFQFRVNNGDNNTDTKLIIVSDTEKSSYPLKKIVNNEIVDINNTIMGYDNNFTLDDICKYNNGIVQKVWVLNNEDGEYVEKNYGSEGSRYTENGQFILSKNNIKTQKFYVVALTSNNCRCLSPLYDFSDVNVNVIITNRETLNEKQETNDDKTTITDYETLIDYTLDVDLVGEIPYYLQWYPYNVLMDFYITDNIKLQEEKNVMSKITRTSFEVNENLYRILNSLFGSSKIAYVKYYIDKHMNITYKDCTKLSLPVINKECKTETLYAVQWSLNESIGEYEQVFKLNKEIPSITIENDTTKPIELTGELISYEEDNTIINKLISYEEPKLKGKQFVGWFYYDGTKEENGTPKGIKIDFGKTAVNKSIIIKPIFENVVITFNANSGKWNDNRVTTDIVVDEDFVAEITEMPTIDKVNGNKIEKGEFYYWKFNNDNISNYKAIVENKVCCSVSAQVDAHYKHFNVIKNKTELNSYDVNKIFILDIESYYNDFNNGNIIDIDFTYSGYNDDLEDISDGKTVKFRIKNTVVPNKTWNIKLTQKGSNNEIIIPLKYNAI